MNDRMFTNKDLRAMIIPLFIEQFLLLLVGMADTFVVSFVGDAAVSGVSLVNSFNTVAIFLFSALASGGAVIISQYIGSKDNEQAGKAASQLLMFSVVSSVVISVLILVFERPLLNLLFGRVEDDVMAACVEYMRITAYSFPALAVYNAGAAMCRSVGRADVSMYISAFANAVNVVGNIIGVFVLHAGVAGVAYPSLITRTISAVAVTWYCFMHRKTPVRYTLSGIFAWHGSLLKKVLGIAVPNGVENGVHQIVKVALSSMVAQFGTYQIAATGVSQSIWSLAALMGMAMAPVYTTVIGQCMGAGNIEEANYYFKKLNKLTFILSLAWNTAVFAMTPLLLKFFAISDEAKHLVLIMVLINNAINAFAYTYAGPLGSGLRAAGDVKFTMTVSVVLTVAARLFFSALFGLWLNMGAVGVAIGTSMDLLFRGAIFFVRYKNQKWTKFKLI